MYMLKSPQALYMALREAGVCHDTAMKAADALAADFMALATQISSEEGASGEYPPSSMCPRKGQGTHLTDGHRIR